MTYAFTFDASACSGCKACQVACKDKNELPLGVLWRRIYQSGGGEWTRTGEAWTSSVYTYHLSVACNHCVHPKCAGVCPVNAFSVREDGIVLLDSSKCIGCGYCSWACPYGAPQFDRGAGVMTKCDFCQDNLTAGLPPACVAACPMRVLDLVDQPDLEAKRSRPTPVFPMPAVSRTEPRLYVKPHPAALKAEHLPQLFNREEYAPQRGSSPAWAARQEIPLLVFTLLSQFSAGISWIAGLFILAGIRLPPLVGGSVGILIGLGLMAAFLHLGKPLNAWRVFSNLVKSWLSREILTALIFLGLWAYGMLPYVLGVSPPVDQPFFTCFLGLVGAAMVYSMAEVYRLWTVPAWIAWRTKAAFFLTGLILGGLAVLALGLTANASVPLPKWLAPLLLVLLCLELAVDLQEKVHVNKALNRTRKWLIGATAFGMALTLFLPLPINAWLVVLIFLTGILEEVLGRWSFYARRNPAM
jgi:anaerobic dimethyl sulfoxide reductase subunit B (iron-sulfur subunit)